MDRTELLRLLERDPEIRRAVKHAASASEETGSGFMGFLRGILGCASSPEAGAAAKGATLSGDAKQSFDVDDSDDGFAMTEVRRTAIFDALKGTPVTAEDLTGALRRNGLPADTSKLTRQQYSRIFELIDELVEQAPLPEAAADGEGAA